MFNIPIWFHSLIIKAPIKISGISKDYIGFKTFHLLLPSLHKRIVMGEKKEERYMNKKTVIILFLLALIIFAGAPTSFAQTTYINNLTEVYNNSSCGTCHENGDKGGPRTSYGMSFENQSNHVTDASAALLAIGAPPKSTAAKPAVSMTATPIKVTPQITEEEDEEIPVDEEIPADENPEATEAKGSPGFGFVASLVGLTAWALITKRYNK